MRRGGGPLTVLALAQAATTYEFTVAFVALPALVADLDVPPAIVPWVPGAYAATFGGGLLAAGRLVDRHGVRRVVALAPLALAATTAVVALAGSPAVLLAGRAGQGLAAAALQPAVLAAMSRVATGPPRARAWGVWSAVGAGGLAAGTTLGGVLTDIDWRLAVGVVVPICLLVAGCAGVLPAGPAAEPVPVPVLPAVAATTAGVTAAATVTLATSEGVAAPGTVVVGAVAAVALAGLVVGERTATPLIGNDLRRRPDVRLAAGLAAAYMTGPGALYFLLTTVPGARLGLVLLTLGVVAGSALGGRVIGRLGEERGAGVGFAVVAVGSVGVALGVRSAQLGPGATAGVFAGSLIAGLGSGLTFTAVFALAGRDVPERRRGAAGAVVAAAQYLASAVALAVFGALGGEHGSGLMVAAGVSALGVVAALVGRRSAVR